jgi:hypothetical protein
MDKFEKHSRPKRMFTRQDDAYLEKLPELLTKAI